MGHPGPSFCSVIPGKSSECFFENFCEFTLAAISDSLRNFSNTHGGLFQKPCGFLHPVFTDVGGNGIAVLFFKQRFQGGEIHQVFAGQICSADALVKMSGKLIVYLMDIRPDYANLETDAGLERVDPDEVAVGSLIVVQPGENVPIDGVIEEGHSVLNTSALTVESRPADVAEGDRVLSGSINMSGLLKIRTAAEFEESTASKILDLVENASSRKSKSENFISRFARVYTPVVCCLALAVLGLANMWVAIAADVGVMILAVLNAIRCLFAGGK